MIVFQAAALTAGMVIGLYIYAVRTKTDYTGCGAVLFGLMIIMSIACLLMFFMGPTMHLAICVLGVFLFSFYIIYDIQLIVGGKHRQFKFDKDDYIIAAVVLYLDIINLFLFILSILQGGEKN